MDQVRSPLSLSTQQGKITEFPQGTNAVVVVVEVVVVDIEAARAGAPNNDNRNLYQHPSMAPEIETDAATIPSPSPVFYLETRANSFSLGAGTKFCPDVLYRDP